MYTVGRRVVNDPLHTYMSQVPEPSADILINSLPFRSRFYQNLQAEDSSTITAHECLPQKRVLPDYNQYSSIEYNLLLLTGI